MTKRWIGMPTTNKPVLRYRRKIPPAEPTQDNQLEHRTAEPVKGDDVHPEPGSSTREAASVRKKKPKEKFSKRDRGSDASSESNQENSSSLPDDESAQNDLSSTVPATSFRKRKSTAPVGHKHGSSLLKQLLWKAKTPSSAPAARPEDDESEEEERAYAEHTRQSLKAHAREHLSLHQQPEQCEEPSTTNDTEQNEGEEMGPDDLQVFYPEPLSLEALMRGRERGLRVHKVLLEDFSFSQTYLKIRVGDVVVWTVSSSSPAMVEHSLDFSLRIRGDTNFVRATSPPLASGSAFAWRFGSPGRLHVECSVYQTRCVVLVNDKKDKRTQTSPPSNKTKAKAKKSYRKREMPAAPSPSRLSVGSDSEEQVFHPADDLTRCPEEDAGVCRAVLSQLAEVTATTPTPTGADSPSSARPSIVIGDVECPLVDDDREKEVETDEPSDSHVECNQKEKSSVVEDLSGTEDEDDLLPADDEDQIQDFQAKVISMLKRSEESRARHRSSFQQEASGFDAGAAYDFFKRRFSQVQKEEREIVYAVCPEQSTGSGVDVTDIMSLLAGVKS
ncbi:hypothetical protein PINS_up007038 [Pythium insidiosum]|nr:hypothetical protein PINS_up007038 [Pythium insidiosum]